MVRPEVTPNLKEVSVDVVHAFGACCGTGLRGAAMFSDLNGQFVLHVAGRYIMVRHVDGGEAAFIISDEKVECITACATSHDRSLLAVCERRSVSPVRRIVIYDISGSLNCTLVKTLGPVGSAKERLVGAAFADEGHLMAIICVGAESSVSVLDWRQDGRLIARCRLDQQPDRVAFAPVPGEQAAAMLSVSGSRIMRVLQLRDYPSKIRDSSLKLMPAFAGMDEIRVTDHSWSQPGDGTLIASIAAGVIYILSSTELSVIRSIETPFGKFTGHRPTTPFCVKCFTQGFVIGGGEGMLAVWEKVDTNPSPDGEHREGRPQQPQQYTHAGTARMQHAGKPDTICSLDITGTEEGLLVGFQNNNISVVQILTLYTSKTGIVDCTAAFGGHAGPIVGLDIAAQRPLVASACKQDGTVRIWNHATKQCEVRSTFPGEAPTAVALHPFGYFLAVAFSEKLRFFYVLDTSLKLHRELDVHGLTRMRFTHGGHMLAAAQDQFVHVFSTRGLVKIATLNGHTENVIGLCFDPDDHSLWTCAQNGSLCQWDALTWEKVNQHYDKEWRYLAVTSGASGHICCSGRRETEGCLRRFGGCDIEGEQVFPGPLTAVCTYAGTNIIFGGSTTGAVRVRSASTAAEKVTQPAMREWALHAGPVNFLLLSADGRTLVTGGEDGAIFLLNVKGLAPAEDDTARLPGAADIVLVHRAEVTERQDECEKLRSQNVQLKAKIAAQAKSMLEECTQQIDEARVQDHAEIQELERRCEATTQASNAKEREGQHVRKSMEETHGAAYNQLRNLYERKVEHEAERFTALEVQKVRLLEEIARTEEETMQRLEEQQARADAELERQLAEKDLEIQKHKDLIAFTQNRFDSILAAVGEEHDEEVAEMKLRSHAVLEEQKKMEQNLKKEQDTLEQGRVIMSQEKARLEREQQDAMMVIKSMKEQSEDYTRIANSLTAEMKERASTLHDKDQKIETYKVKVEKLKKFKRMLDQQLAEVTESLEPKDQLIGQLQKTLQELQAEFETQVAQMREVEGTIEQKSQLIDILSKEEKKLQETIKEKDLTIMHYTTDLHSLVCETPDERQWPTEIRRLYHTYVCGLQSGEDHMPVEKMQVKIRQVERQVTGLGVKCAQQKSMCKGDFQRKANENAMLVAELNELRMHKKSFQTQIKNLTAKLEELHAAEAQAAIADAAQRPALQDAAAPPAPKRASSGSLPRTPSGTLPGPRQQSSTQSLAIVGPNGGQVQARARSVPPIAKSKPKARRMKVSPEDQLRLHSMMKTTEDCGKALQQRRAEKTDLRQQIDELMTKQHTKDDTLEHLRRENLRARRSMRPEAISLTQRA